MYRHNRVPRERDERGATIVLLALTLVALMAVAGLAVDGGAAYSDRRQAQNAADAAALAGAGALNTYWYDATPDAADIWSAVTAKMTENKMNGTISCYYIDENGNPADSSKECSTYSGATVPSNASGVAVLARDTQPTNFVKLVGFNDYSVKADAAANVQALRGGTSPILLCAVAGSDTAHSGNGKGVTGPAGAVPAILLPDGSVNPAAYYVDPNPNDAAPGSPIYYLKGVEVKDTCSTGNNFKGVVDNGHGSHDDGITYPLPGPWQYDNGNQAGPTRTKVLGACNDEAIGCKILVPLCYYSASVPSGALYCAKMGVFLITAGDSNTYQGGFLKEGGVVDLGQGGGKPIAGEARVIKLTK